MFLNSVKETLKVNSNNTGISIKYYALLALSFMVYGRNNVIDLLAIIFIVVLFLLNKDSDEFLYSYFAIIFFEAVLVIPFVGGSLFRIFQFVFLIRVLNEILRLKSRSMKFEFTYNTVALIVFFGSSVVYIEGFSSLLSSVMNAIILLYLCIKILQEQSEESYSKILAVVGIFVCLSGLYGLIYGAGIDYGYTMRISATIGDPNYSSLFYTIGLFSLVGTHAINKKWKIIMFSTICVLLILTISMSGIFGTLLLLIMYFATVNYKRALLFIGSLATGFIIFLKVKFAYGTTLFGIQFRILQIIDSQDLSYITSGRTRLVVEYTKLFGAQPLFSKIFGGSNTISGEFRDTLVKLFDYVSHNSYIDMLFMIGIVGTISIVGLFFLMIRRNIRLYNSSKNLVYLSLAFIKLTILYYALSLSIFPFRYFYTFLIL